MFSYHLFNKKYLNLNCNFVLRFEVCWENIVWFWVCSLFRSSRLNYLCALCTVLCVDLLLILWMFLIVGQYVLFWIHIFSISLYSSGFCMQIPLHGFYFVLIFVIVLVNLDMMTMGDENLEYWIHTKVNNCPSLYMLLSVLCAVFCLKQLSEFFKL